MTRERMTLERARAEATLSKRDVANLLGVSDERTVNARLNARLNSWPMIRIPAEAPESVVQHRNAVDVARHLADWMRTRITPGADPLAEWDDEVQIEAARELMDGGTRVVEFSYVDEHGDRINCVSNESLSLQPLFDDAHRDVPCDVVRWRDPKHRAAMTERAREYASHLPGRRA